MYLILLMSMGRRRRKFASSNKLRSCSIVLCQEWLRETVTDCGTTWASCAGWSLPSYTYKRCKKCTRQYLGLVSCAWSTGKAALFIFSCIFKLGWSFADAWFVGLESKEWVEKNPAKFHISFFFFFLLVWHFVFL